MGKNYRNESNKLRLDLSISILDMMISYIFSQNSNVNKRSILKMKEFFDIIDKEVFEKDRQLEVRVFLLEKLLEGRVTKRILDLSMLAESVLGGQYDDEVMDIYGDLDEVSDLSDDEVFFIDEYISDRITFGYLYQYEEKLDEKLIQLRAGDFNSLSEFNDEVEEIVASLFNEIKKAKAQSRYASRDFGTDGDSLDIAVSGAITNLRRESNMMRTGVKLFNKLLGGGHQAGRAYLYLGMFKGWKSGFLLNACLWGKHFNTDVVTKDPTKTPCILYVTHTSGLY